MIIRQVYHDRKRIKYICRNRKVIWESEKGEPIKVATTPSILGVAVLNRTLLGCISSGLPKLDAPVIRITSSPQLDAPVIWLHTSAEEPDVPDVPEIQKLGAPVIWLDDGSEEPVIPEIKKLATPVIRLYSEGDEPEVPDEPDIPDVPEVKKLSRPTIYLESDEPEVPKYNTTAILGKALVGCAVLGSEGVTLPKLNAPNIYLSSDARRKLEAPIIELETVNDDAIKLEAPVIYLDTQAPVEPPIETQKLDAPVIYLYVDEPDVPDEPVISKLDAPVIELVTESEPVEPDEPVVEKLTTPEIYLDTAHQHTVVIRNAVEPTCTEPGLTEGRYCGDCGDVLVAQTVVPALGHVEEVILGYPATSTEDGLTAGVRCSRCGEILVEQQIIPAVGLPSLEAPDIYLDEVHTHEYTSTKTEPTCTERGYTTHSCGCGESYIDSYVDALGHDWSEPYYSDEFATGYGRKCSRCNELEAIEALEKLDTPTISLIGAADKLSVILEGDTLSWNAVDRPNVLYVISADVDEPVTTNGRPILSFESGNVADLYQCFARRPAGTYSVCVCYYVDGVYSQWSDPVIYEYDGTALPKLASPEIYLETVLPKLAKPWIVPEYWFEADEF